MCIWTQQHVTILVANMVAMETCGRNVACIRYKWLLSFPRRQQNIDFLPQKMAAPPPEPLSTRYNLPKQTSRLLPCSWCTRYNITLHTSHTYHLRTANQHIWVYSSYSSPSEKRFYPKSRILDTEWVHYSWISNLWPVCKPFNWIILWLPGINWFSVHKVKKQVNKLHVTYTCAGQLRTSESRVLHMHQWKFVVSLQCCEVKKWTYTCTEQLSTSESSVFHVYQWNTVWERG